MCIRDRYYSQSWSRITKGHIISIHTGRKKTEVAVLPGTSWFKVRERPKKIVLSATDAACNMYSDVTYFVSYWPPWTTGNGGIASYFVQDLGRALAAKMCPDQSRAFKMVINIQAFPYQETFVFCFLFLNEAVLGARRHFYKTFRANILHSVVHYQILKFNIW